MASIHSFVPGNVIGGYEILRTVGKNSWGEVYLVKHQKSNRAYALKTIFSDQLSADRQWHDRFVQCRTSVAGIHHPNLVESIDYFRVEDFRMSCVVTEFMPNGSLLEYLSRHPEDNTVPFVLNVVESMAAALAEIDKNHLIHGNITPTNILLTENNQVKLADLGMLKSPDSGSDTLTRFSAPETLDNKEDIRSDIYSVGMVLYLMTAGQLPFHPEEFFERLAKEGLPEPKSICPFIHPAINDFIVQLTDRDPAKRPQTVVELQNMVELLKSGKSAAAKETPPASSPAAPQSAPAFLKKNSVPPAPSALNAVPKASARAAAVPLPSSQAAAMPPPVYAGARTASDLSGEREDELVIDETKMRQQKVVKFSWNQLPSLLLMFSKNFWNSSLVAFSFLKGPVIQCAILGAACIFGGDYLSAFSSNIWTQQEQAAIAQSKLDHMPEKREKPVLQKLLAQDGQWESLQLAVGRDDCLGCIEQLKMQKDPDALMLAATLMMLQLQHGKEYSEKDFLSLLEQAAAAGSREAAGFLRDWYECSEDKQKAQIYRQMLSDNSGK